MLGFSGAGGARVGLLFEAVLPVASEAVPEAIPEAPVEILDDVELLFVGFAFATFLLFLLCLKSCSMSCSCWAVRPLLENLIFVQSFVPLLIIDVFEILR